MIRFRTVTAAAALSVAAAFTFAGCGGDDAGCETSVAFTNKSAGTEVDVSSTGSVSLGGGAAYTLYVADFELDLESVSLTSSPVPPADGNLATIAITVFNSASDPEPITAGTTVEASTATDELVFVVTAARGTEFFGNNAGADGELTVTEVGKTVCIDVDYSDDEKEISGTIEAAVKEL